MSHPGADTEGHSGELMRQVSEHLQETFCHFTCISLTLKLGDGFREIFKATEDAMWPERGSLSRECQTS